MELQGTGARTHARRFSRGFLTTGAYQAKIGHLALAIEIKEDICIF